MPENAGVTVPDPLPGRTSPPGVAAGRSYVHQMRGPLHRWWRPPLALLGMLVTLATLFLGVGVPLALLGVTPTVEELTTTALGQLVGNLSISLLAVAGVAGLAVGFWRSPWRVLSVAGRLRWRWLGLCHLVVLPLWVVYLVASGSLLGQEPSPRPAAWAGIVVVSLLTTPLQAAAEEVFFRGALVQAVGAWFRRPLVAFVVSTVVSTAAFGLAHGSTDPWVLAELAALGVVGCHLTWRTGGLEAAIALHVVNNVLVTVSGAVLGGLSESYVDAGTTGTPVATVSSWVATVVAAVVLLRFARRRGLAPAGALRPAEG